MGQFWVSIKDPKNWWYAIQGYLLSLIAKLYNKYVGHKIDELMYAVYVCPTCYENNHCEECGCSFKELILSDKKCKRHV